MPTTAVTAGHLALIKKTDGAARHLIIFARGTQSGRNFTVPDGKTIHHYVAENQHLQFGIETFELAIRGKLQPRESYTTGQRTTDYTLTPARGNPLHHHAAYDSEARLHRYVEQSDRATGAMEPVDAYGLGRGVSCDILSMRQRKVSNWFMESLARLSHLMYDDLLSQYEHIHCFFGRVKWSGVTELSQAPLQFR